MSDTIDQQAREYALAFLREHSFSENTENDIGYGFRQGFRVGASRTLDEAEIEEAAKAMAEAVYYEHMEKTEWDELHYLDQQLWMERGRVAARALGLRVKE